MIAAGLREFFAKIRKQFTFHFVVRREIAMSAFAREREELPAIEKDSRFAQTRAGGNDRRIAGSIGLAGIQRYQI